ncbi:hypothetical protein VHEMI02425 [[Torrubiella] hemipterigena]|uniref:Extracellular membrane protein CFEM domain-containing protein n=1 Tax=[Torrubiella] hemipterigena TaxID=1531966 RepID=A0A0A1T857_9HYPO|nr:hypothetical protein VHEMI02425 [[Torrubiella] hemipterigena]
MPTFSSLPQCFRSCAAKTFSCKDSDVNCICRNYLNGGDIMLAFGCLLTAGGDSCNPTDVVSATTDLDSICRASGIKPTTTANDGSSNTLPTNLSVPGTTGRGGSAPTPTDDTSSSGSSGSNGNSGSSTSSHSGGLPTAAIAGIGAGAGVILILIAVIIFLICRRRRKVPQLVQTQTEALLPPSQPSTAHQPPSPLSSPSPAMQQKYAAPGTVSSVSPLTSAASPSPYVDQRHVATPPVGYSPTPPPTMQKQYEPAVLVHEMGASTYSAANTTAEPIYEMPAGDARPVGSSHGELPNNEVSVAKAT